MKYIFLVLFLGVASSFYARVAMLSPLPFRLGERFSLRIHILGMNVGNYFMRISSTTNINGRTYYIAHGQIITRPDLRHLYDMDTRDWTIFDAATMFPIYNERFVKEGRWVDHVRQTFIPAENVCYYYHQTRGYERNEMRGNLPIMDYNTLMLYFRSLDYSKIGTNEQILVNYKHRDTLYQSSFRYRRITVTHRQQQRSAIQVIENGGLGIFFTMLDDEHRTPYEIRIAAFYIAGFRFVDLKVSIENYQAGTRVIN